MNISDRSCIAIYRSQDRPRVDLRRLCDLEINNIDSIAIVTSENPIVQLIYGSIVNSTLNMDVSSILPSKSQKGRVASF